jgi:hypothetical protein
MDTRHLPLAISGQEKGCLRDAKFSDLFFGPMGAQR